MSSGKSLGLSESSLADCVRISGPVYSDWNCYLFGPPGQYYSMAYRPLKGEEPNWFWRKMQFLMFGHRWVREPRSGG
jgi:hypothetical protein